MNNSNYYHKPLNKLFFDIETIPADIKMKDIAINNTILKQNKNLGKKITKSKTFLYRQTAISGDFGQIFCIGHALNNGKVEIIKGSEKELLKNWWEIVKQVDLFIGHNIFDFDLRFIYKRSIVHKIKPSQKHINMSFARYRNFPIYDTMREWEKWSPSYISLDTLAKALSLKTSKTKDIDGSKVYDYYLKGKLEDIYKYCIRDVELTRQIYNMMTFYG